MHTHKKSNGGGGTCTFCKNECKVMTVFNWQGNEADTKFHYESECCGAELVEEIWKDKGCW